MFFRKKKDQKGKGTDDVVALRKEFDVLNYTPVDYRYTVRYVEFKKNAAIELGKIIEKASVDSLCANMCDAYIDAVIVQMKTQAKEDYTYHMYLINHHRGIQEGNLLAANSHLENLTQDLKELESEIEKYNQMKQEKGIH